MKQRYLIIGHGKQAFSSAESYCLWTERGWSQCVGHIEDLDIEDGLIHATEALAQKVLVMANRRIGERMAEIYVQVQDEDGWWDMPILVEQET